jgi:membrane protein YqaA with SNARE-associated domain
MVQSRKNSKTPATGLPIESRQSWATCLWFYGMIFLESIIFPIPVDPFLAIQSLKHPTRIWRIALWSTGFSSLGGLTMYVIGLWFYGHFSPFLMKLCGGEAVFLKVQDFMQSWGVWAIAFKTFLPIPYKIMAVVAGMTQIPVVLFILASLLGRGLKFFSICFLVHRYHAKANAILARHLSWIHYIGYAVILVGILVLLVRYFWFLYH